MKLLIYLTILVFSASNLWAGDATGTSGAKPPIKRKKRSQFNPETLAGLEIAQVETTDKGGLIKVQLIEVTDQDTLIFSINKKLSERTVIEADLDEVEFNTPTLANMLAQSMKDKGTGMVHVKMNKPNGRALKKELETLTSFQMLPQSAFGWVDASLANSASLKTNL